LICNHYQSPTERAEIFSCFSYSVGGIQATAAKMTPQLPFTLSVAIQYVETSD
jgi:hypothetical protein